MSNVDGDTLLFITDYFDLSLPIISVATFYFILRIEFSDNV